MQKFGLTIYLMVTLALSCSDSTAELDAPEEKNSSSTTNGFPNTTGTIVGTANERVMVNGEVRLYVDRARQINESRYELYVWVANGLHESIDIGPGRFKVAYANGLISDGSADPVLSDCPTVNRLSSFATHECRLEFRNLTELPTRLVYSHEMIEVYQTFTFEACETCGTAQCVNLAEDPRHCGSCFDEAVAPEICFAGQITCPDDYQTSHGFCLASNDFVLVPNPGSSQFNCVEQCEIERRCEGVLLDVDCPRGNDHYDGSERTLPGLVLCSNTGAELVARVATNNCNLKSAACVCAEI